MLEAVKKVESHSIDMVLCVGNFENPRVSNINTVQSVPQGRGGLVRPGR